MLVSGICIVCCFLLVWVYKIHYMRIGIFFMKQYICKLENELYICHEYALKVKLIIFNRKYELILEFVQYVYLQ